MTSAGGRPRLLAMSALPQIAAALRGAGHSTLNALLPPRCLSCGVLVATPGSLCASCWEGVDFLAPPHCGTCGLPFEYDPGPEVICGACLRKPPPYGRARAVLRYDDHSRGLILAFKHGDRTDGAPAYGAWLARAGAELLAEADLILPVPLHWRRLIRRRYNQAGLLAQALGRTSGLPYRPDLLRRRRHTPPQGRLSPAERKRNLRGAFEVVRSRKAEIEGRRLLLVDDVMTTGATLAACARTLRRAGAAQVDALVLARVVRPAPEP